MRKSIVVLTVALAIFAISVAYAQGPGMMGVDNKAGSIVLIADNLSGKAGMEWDPA
jgi:hypothetical protein